ncbi:unnamed protein product, partial [Didymodactylos carnosus]
MHSTPNVKSSSYLTWEQTVQFQIYLKSMESDDFNVSQIEGLSEDSSKLLTDYINNLKEQKRSISDDYAAFKVSTEQRFHDLTVDYERVRDKVVKHDEIENQLRQQNDEFQQKCTNLENNLSTVQQTELALKTKLVSLTVDMRGDNSVEQFRQIEQEKDRLSNVINEQEKAFFELQKQRDLLEEENRQVHNANFTTITKLQELESASSQLENRELIWDKERQLYQTQIQQLEQTLVEAKRQSIEQQTKIMQLTCQLESVDSKFQAQTRSLDISLEEKNTSLLNIDRQLREKIQRVEQLQSDLQRTTRQAENQDITTAKTIQSLKSQIDELMKKNQILNEKCDEQSQTLIKVSSERDVLKNEIKSLSETYERQSNEH